MTADMTTPDERPNHYGAASDLYFEASNQLRASAAHGLAGEEFAATLAMENGQLVARLAQTQALLAVVAELREIRTHLADRRPS